MLQTHVIDRLVGELAPQQQASFREQYDALRNLPASGTDLQSFLGEFIRGVAGLYAASAAAIWFRNPDGNQLERKADVGYQAISLEDELLPAHDALLDFGMRQKAPLLVKPFSAPHSAAVVSNPTDSFVVLGPVIHHGDAIALIELFLGPVPLRGQTATVREQYVEWLAHLISFLCDGIERRYLASGKPLEAAMSLLDQAQAQVQRYQEEIRTSIEQSFADWQARISARSSRTRPWPSECITCWKARACECSVPSVVPQPSCDAKRRAIPRPVSFSSITTWKPAEHFTAEERLSHR